MSMKILTGKKTTFKNMEEVIAWANEIRPEMIKLAQKKFDKKVASCVMDVICNIYEHKKIPENFGLVFSNSRYKEGTINPKYSLSIQASGEVYCAAKHDIVNLERNPDIDFRSELLVIPHKGEFYAIWYGEDVEFEKFINSQDELEDFWYDGRTDGPEDMEYDEYEARGETWRDIFKNYSYPSDVGVVVELMNKVPCNTDDDEVIKYMVAKRESIIKDMAMYTDTWRDWKKIDGNAELEKQAQENGRIYSLLSDFRKWAKSDGKDLVDKYIKQHEKTFPTKDTYKEYFNMSIQNLFKKITGEEYDTGRGNC